MRSKLHGEVSFTVIKKFVLSQGISKVESSVNFSLIEAANRKILDPITKRYFFVTNPVQLFVNNAPLSEKKLNLHPSNIKLGNRKIQTDNIFYISSEDVENMVIGEVFRLKDLFNVEIIEKNEIVIANYKDEKLIPNSKKIQWTTNNYIKMDIYIAEQLYKDGKYNSKSLHKVNGYAEEAVSKLVTDEIVQFERFGFVKIKKTRNQLTGYFTHK